MGCFVWVGEGLEVDGGECFEVELGGDGKSRACLDLLYMQKAHFPSCFTPTLNRFSHPYTPGIQRLAAAR